MFAKDISWILLPIHVEETKNLGCNSFTHTMIRQCIVALVQSRVRYGGTSDNRLVITKDITLGLDWDTKVMQGIM